MSGKSNAGKRRGATPENGARNARGQFIKGSPGGPGRGHSRERGDLAVRPTPVERPRTAAIVRGDLLELIRRDRGEELERLRAEVARLERELERCLEAIRAALAARELAAARAVLAAALGVEEAERPGSGVAGPAGAGAARLGGEPAAQDGPAVPLPAGKRGPRMVYDGTRRVPIPPSWGGTIESDRPRPRGVGGIGDPYGDSGPLDPRD